MSFNRLARHYSWVEWLLAGRKLQSCRTAFTQEIREAGSVLLAGEGHGRFLLHLCQQNPRAAICCVDSSSAMIRVAQRRLDRHGVGERPIEFHAIPILEFEPTCTFDTVVTHFFLDCFTNETLDAIVSRLAAALQPRGKWIIADFQIPEDCRWRRCRARIVLALAYSFFRVAVRLPANRLADPRPSFIRHGLVRREKREFNFGLLYSELWEKSARGW
ncbi:MAG: class I SAM-dependent methyltransferase [Verrucomicrobiota bacterium]